jgi:hypothetical protein
MAGTLGELKTPGAMSEVKQEMGPEAGTSFMPSVKTGAEGEVDESAGASGAIIPLEGTNAPGPQAADMNRGPILDPSQPELGLGDRVTPPELAVPQP